MQALPRVHCCKVSAIMPILHKRTAVTTSSPSCTLPQAVGDYADMTQTDSRNYKQYLVYTAASSVITAPAGHLTDTSAPSVGPEFDDVWHVQIKRVSVKDDVTCPKDFWSR